MQKEENHKEFLLKNICFSDIRNLNLEKIQFIKTGSFNNYLYKSKGFKILSWNFKPEIIFSIKYGENNILVETNEKLINGLGVFSEIMIIRVNFNILKNNKNSCIAKRSIILGVKKRPIFLRFIPNKLFKILLSQSLELIAKRVDKKLLLKLS